jgi:hypothetical protein
MDERTARRAVPTNLKNVTNYCFNLKNRFPVGGVTVTLFVPLLVVMV